jgi:hypothetical protein
MRADRSEMTPFRKPGGNNLSDPLHKLDTKIFHSSQFAPMLIGRRRFRGFSSGPAVFAWRHRLM